MKKILFLLLLLLSPSMALAENKPLYVTIWAEYLPGWVWQEFYQETNIKVITRFYAQRSMGYEQILKTLPHNDLALTCFEHAQYLQQQDKIAPIDFERLQNKNYLQLFSLPKEFRQNFSHCLPFDWHLLGLVVNSQLIDPARLGSFAALWDDDITSRLYLPEEPRVLASMGLLALDASCNSDNAGKVNLARQNMEKLLPLADGVANYGLHDAMARGNTAVGLVWSGMSTGFNLNKLSNIKFVVPAGKPVLLVEGWVISKQAANLEGAYAFMDFLMRPDIAARLAGECGYPTINTQAKLPAAVAGNILYNPPLNMVREAELEKYVPLITRAFKDLCRPTEDNF